MLMLSVFLLMSFVNGIDLKVYDRTNTLVSVSIVSGVTTNINTLTTIVFIYPQDSIPVGANVSFYKFYAGQYTTYLNSVIYSSTSEFFTLPMVFGTSSTSFKVKINGEFLIILIIYSKNC